LRHIANEKAKTYVVAFFNGDVKVFSKHDHSEVLSVKQLHQDSQIEDALFLKSDSLNKKLLITVAGGSESELKVSEISHIQTGGKKQYQFNPLAQSRDEFNGIESFVGLSYNPMNTDYICSGGIIPSAENSDRGILVWKLDQ
jgi:hypothetical protein